MGKKILPSTLNSEIGYNNKPQKNILEKWDRMMLTYVGIDVNDEEKKAEN